MNLHILTTIFNACYIHNQKVKAAVELLTLTLCPTIYCDKESLVFYCIYFIYPMKNKNSPLALFKLKCGPLDISYYSLIYFKVYYEYRVPFTFCRASHPTAHIPQPVHFSPPSTPHTFLPYPLFAKRSRRFAPDDLPVKTSKKMLEYLTATIFELSRTARQEDKQ